MIQPIVQTSDPESEVLDPAEAPFKLVAYDSKNLDNFGCMPGHSFNVVVPIFKHCKTKVNKE